MTDTITIFDADKVAAITKAMPARKIYDSLAEAKEALQTASDSTEQFFGLPVLSRFDLDDAEAWGESQVCVGRVGKKVDVSGDGKKEAGVKAIAIFPVFTLDEFVDDEKGREFLTKIMVKESAHAAFRNYRDADTIESMTAGMASSPASVADYATEAQRGGNAIDLTGWNATYQKVRDWIKGKRSDVEAALPNKTMLLRCIRSKSEAEAYDANLEAVDIFTQFATVAIMMIDKAADDELDSSVIQGWIDGRDSFNYPAPKAKEAFTGEGFTLDL